jgi:hypothetical protein
MEELVSGEERYGFRIIGNDREEDFYCESAADQERWLTFLEQIMICTDLHADYELLDRIGEGSFGTVHRAIEVDT